MAIEIRIHDREVIKKDIDDHQKVLAKTGVYMKDFLLDLSGHKTSEGVLEAAIAQLKSLKHALNRFTSALFDDRGPKHIKIFGRYIFLR